MIAIKKILMDYLEAPMGIDALPAFAWVLESDGRNVMQTAYQLQIALDGAFGSPVYDSGRVESGESAHVRVQGVALLPCTAYHVRARVWTQAEESPWSAAARFVTGMLDKPWTGRFISAENADDWSNSKGT